MASLANQKALGAFYTAENIAQVLVRWAVRQPEDTVLDPSCGNGVFLDASLQRLRSLGSRRPDVSGIDFDPEATGTAKRLFPTCRIMQEDFFSIGRENLGQFDAVVGNPPFIRYQSFSGKARSAALDSARTAGVKIPQLASSWAPFLVHASVFLREGGRLAMVVPAEIGHAQYAQEVLRYLTNQFGRIKVCLFRRKLFPDINEDTFLLLAEGFGSPCRWFTVGAFNSISDMDIDTEIGVPVDVAAIRSGHVRLAHYLLSPKVRHLYKALSEEEDVVRLGEAADVGIGYVTGCNDFFHLSRTEVKKWGIPKRFLKPAVTSLGDHEGLVFSKKDWDKLNQSGRKVFLLALPDVRTEKLPSGVREYIAHGRTQLVHDRYKCRVRDHWYSVPHVRVADAFLSYMSGGLPKLVLNHNGFVAPNTLHLIRFLNSRSKRAFASGWYSSLTRLSCELEGHPLGGGMLKLEPTEAERLLVALPSPKEASRFLTEVDLLVRGDRSLQARQLVDSFLLRRKFGLSATECSSLREAATFLEAWRMHR